MDEAVRMPETYDQSGRDSKLVELLLSEIAHMPLHAAGDLAGADVG
ncbi:hypothetical protein [Bradyrhizobium acaciae]|nr:hypothetical protein [Bradyrhizobium acaciae]MCC8977390.1 hypothetical protein [Bradyrhizobium acaciae]